MLGPRIIYPTPPLNDEEQSSETTRQIQGFEEDSQHSTDFVVISPNMTNTTNGSSEVGDVQILPNENLASLSIIVMDDEKNYASNLQQDETSLAFQDINTEVSSTQILTSQFESLNLDRLSLIAIPLELYLKMRRGGSISI